MSYNVAVVVPPIPDADEEAWKALDAFIEEQGDMPDVFQRLHDQLIAKYPCVSSLPADQASLSVWGEEPLIDDFGVRAAVLGIASSRAEEVLPFLIATATALGLVVFDWATDMVHRA